jgi:hypothetical protein
MTTRQRLFALVVLASLPATGLAAPSADPAARRAQIVSSAEKGASFQAGRQTYRVVVGLRATARGPSTAEERLATLGVPAADLLESRGSLVIYRKAAAGRTTSARISAASAVVSVDQDSTFPVVLNYRTGQLGALSGVVVVKLAPGADAQALAQANGLAVDYVAEGIGYAYLRVPDGRDVVAAAAALARDKRARSAHPEVRETFPAPN